MTSDARTWLAELAADLGVEPPTAAEMDDLLSLASVAARASERVAAPVACWLAARSGRSPEAALRAAHELVARSEGAEAPGAPGEDGPSRPSA